MWPPNVENPWSFVGTGWTCRGMKRGEEGGTGWVGRTGEMMAIARQ